MPNPLSPVPPAPVPPAPAHLLLIDPQNDFCDLPAPACPPGLRPALPVPGADADLHRVAALLRAAAGRIDAVTVTLDSHAAWDIAHPPFWRRADGGAVAPFTPIRAEQVRQGEFLSVDAHGQPSPPLQARALAYLDALEAGARHTLMVWPEHGLEGSWGHALHPAIEAACADWARQRGRAPLYVRKGRNPWTEHYSALQAEVPDPADPATRPDPALLARLAAAGEILIAGQASSHCVRASVEHLLDLLARPQRLTLLVDGMSPVPGFEAVAQAFLQDAQARGARLLRCAEWLAEVGAVNPVSAVSAVATGEADA